MKRLLAVLLAVLLSLGALPMAMAEEAAAEPVKRVILDSDMNYLGDDGQSLLMLAQADKLGMVDFLGVTLSGGNSWLANEACAALRQLEMLGREDIPVYAGCEVPIMGFRDQHAESVLFGYPEYAGVYYDRNSEEFLDPADRPDISEYLTLYPEPSYGYPETARLQEGHAVDFIIEQVHKYPGEVTILVMGSSTNIALAVRQALRLQYDGTLDLRNALGRTGTVYLTVPPGRSSPGKVTLTVQEQLTEFEALTDSPAPIPTGSPVRVTGLAGRGALLVEPIPSESEETE